MTHLWAFVRCISADAAAPFAFSLSTANAIVTVVAAAVVVVAAVGAVVLLLLIVVIAVAVVIAVVVAVVVVQPFVLVIIVIFVVLVVVVAAAAVVRIEVKKTLTFCQQVCVFFCDVIVASCVIYVSKRVFAAGHNWAGKVSSPSAPF